MVKISFVNHWSFPSTPLAYYSSFVAISDQIDDGPVFVCFFPQVIHGEFPCGDWVWIWLQILHNSSETPFKALSLLLLFPGLDACGSFCLGFLYVNWSSLQAPRVDLDSVQKLKVEGLQSNWREQMFHQFECSDHKWKAN